MTEGRKEEGSESNAHLRGSRWNARRRRDENSDAVKMGGGYSTAKSSESCYLTAVAGVKDVHM